MNIANQLTVLRLFLVPVFFAALWIERGQSAFPIAGTVFLVASATDFLDGYLARKYHLITDFGKFMDPLADKVLVAAALVSAVGLQQVPAWMAVVIITREYAVSILRAIAASSGQVLAASSGGKLKTLTQLLALLMFLFAVPYAIYMMGAAVLLTLWSGWDYLWKNRQLILGQGRL